MTCQERLAQENQKRKMKEKQELIQQEKCGQRKGLLQK